MSKKPTENIDLIKSIEVPKISTDKPSSEGKSAPINLSHSSVEKYKTCPAMYDFHYNKRIRSKRTSSALLFGSCLDTALNTLLTTDLTVRDIDIFTIQTSKNVFISEMNKWKFQTNVDFFDKDFDKRLLSEKDTKEIDEATPDTQSHLYGWFCLFNRGIAFIDQYVEQVLPLIERVESVQKCIKKKNQYGDTITCHLDVVIAWKPCDFSPNSSFTSVSDHKTSSASYSQKKTDESPQLSLYTGFEGLEYQTYVVFRKDLDSKGLIRPIQILHAKVNKEVVNSVMQEFDDTLNNIKQGIFPRTSKKWQCDKHFGKPCIYKSICRNGKELSECETLEQK